MAVNERPPAAETDALLPKTSDPETQSDDALDTPKIPGVKIQYILPALGLGVSTLPFSWL